MHNPSITLGRNYIKIHFKVGKPRSCGRQKYLTTAELTPPEYREIPSWRASLVLLFYHEWSLWYMLWEIHFSIPDKGRQRSKKPGENRREKRYSYKLPQEYNIETVVVADPAMVSYHGADAARRFILTILNMVSKPQCEVKGFQESCK